MLPPDPGQPQPTTSQARTPRPDPKGHGPLTLDDFRPLLADHADYPTSICAHPDPADHPREQGATIASVLLDLNARHVWLAAGHPCQAPYELLDVAL